MARNRNPSDRYQRVKLLGEGGAGQVWLARDRLRGGRLLALKELTENRPEHVASLRREFAALSTLKHPSLVEVYDFETSSDGRARFSMEYVEGSSFVDAVRDGGPDLLLELLAETLRALSFLHDFGILHRDIKPGNIVVRQRPDSDRRIAVLDFGLAMAESSAGEIPPAAGTLPYIAPELFEGSEPGRRSDLYALGAVAHEAVWGDPPFGGGSETVTDFVQRVREATLELPPPPPGYPAGIRAWIEELLSKDPAQRPGSGSEALARLNVACGTRYVQDSRITRRARLASGAPPGREAELERLWGMLESKQDPSVVFLTGEAGAGKTRILRWLASEAIRRDWEVLANPQEPADAAGAGGDEPQPVAEERGGEGPESPRLWIVDEAESAEAGVIEFVERFARNPDARSSRVVVALRPTQAGSGKLGRMLQDAEWVPSLERLELRPLGPSSIERVVQRATGTPSATPQQVAWLQEMSEGNALLLESAIVDFAWERRSERATHPTLEQSVRTRLAALSDPARRWIESCVVLGRNSMEASVAEHCRLTPEQVRQATARSVGSGLAIVEEDRWSPASRIVDDVVRADSDAERWKELHHRAAELVAGDEPSDPRRLARLWREAGEARTSIAFAVRAAESQERNGHPEEAARWIRYALEQTGRRDARRRSLRLKHAELLVAAGHYRPALRALATALRLSTNAEERATVLAEQSRVLGLDAQFERAITVAERAIRAAESIGLPEIRARGQMSIGVALARSDRHEQAVPYLSVAAEQFESSGDLSRQAHTIFVLATCASRLGRYSESQNHLDRVLELSHRLADHQLTARALNFQGLVERRFGHTDEALERYRRALRYIESHDLHLQRLLLLGNLAEALIASGRYDEALSIADQMEGSALNLGNRNSHLISRMYRGEALLGIGRPTRATEELTAAINSFGSGVEPRLLGYLQVTLAESLAESPEPDAGRIAQLLREVREQHFDDRKLGFGLLVVEMERRSRSPDEDRFDAVDDEFKERAKTDPARLDAGSEVRAALARNRAALRRGRLQQAIELGRAAATLSRKNGFLALEARSHASVSEAWRRMGNSDRANESLSEAHRLLGEAAQRIGDEEMRRSFLARPVFRSIVTPPSHRALTGERRLMVIYDMIRALNSETDPDELLESMMDMALQVVRAERGLILLREGEQGEYAVRLARGLEKQTIEDAAQFSRNVVLSAGAGRAVLAVDTHKDDRLKDLKSVSLFGIRSVLCVPLRSRGEITGAVYLDNRKEGALFTQDDLRFLEAFADHAALALENARIRKELELENRRLQVAANERVSFDNIIGRSAPMQNVYDLIPRVAESHLPVLIQGESGTGKELVARAIHGHSLRKRRPFLSENCAAIPESLLESELFGHVRGAFTGADRDRAGLFEQADGGTLFLDEIGDMRPSMQARLLRVLQEGELRRVGGQRIIRVDVRLITATHRHLSDEVDAGRFREDLLYRLQVLVIQLPPLRDRPGDVPLLVDHFLRRISRERGQSVPKIRSNVMALLEQYTWPGNVRQLENHIQRLALLAGDGPITMATVESDRGLRRALLGERAGQTPVYSLEHNEREQIRQALGATHGNRTQAAKLLGISRATIFRKIKEYGLS